MGKIFYGFRDKSKAAKEFWAVFITCLSVGALVLSLVVLLVPISPSGKTFAAVLCAVLSVAVVIYFGKRAYERFLFTTPRGWGRYVRKNYKKPHDVFDFEETEGVRRYDIEQLHRVVSSGETHPQKELLFVPVEAMQRFKTKERFARCWGVTAFMIRLHYGGLNISLKEGGRKRISIAFAENDLMIFNNLGKEALRRNHRKKLESRGFGEISEAEELAQKAYDALNNFEHPVNVEGLGKGYPLRWASGGAMPLVTRKCPESGRDETWVALFFRNIHPIGWNIANGASETVEEQLKVEKLIIREFSEELLVYARPPNSGGGDNHIRLFEFEEAFDNKHVRAWSKDHADQHMDLRDQHDGLSITHNRNNCVLVTFDIQTPWEFDIVDPESKESNTVYKIVPTVNPQEFGIELVRFARFRIEPHEILLDGEVHESNDFLTRSPIALVKFSWLYDCLDPRNAEAAGQLGPPDEDGRRQLPKSRDNQRNILVFDYDIRRRQERLDDIAKVYAEVDEPIPAVSSEQLSLRREYEAIKTWCDTFEDTFQETGDETFREVSLESPYGWQLCPVTWKTLRLAIEADLITREGLPNYHR